jgi:hypothetical protein
VLRECVRERIVVFSACRVCGVILLVMSEKTTLKKGAENMRKVVDWDGREVDFDTAFALMDNDIREELHEELSPCSDQRFFNAYLEQHYADYGEEFTV